MYPDYVQLKCPLDTARQMRSGFRNSCSGCHLRLGGNSLSDTRKFMKLNLRLSLFLSGRRTGQGMRPIHGFANL
jgi:hypothetical protein